MFIMEPIREASDEELRKLVYGLEISESERDCLTPKWENVRGGNSLIRGIKYAGRGIYVAAKRMLFQGTNNERQLQKLSGNISNITAVVTQGKRPVKMEGALLEGAIQRVLNALAILEGSGAKSRAMQQIREDLYTLECAALSQAGNLEAAEGALIRAAGGGDPSAAFVLYQRFHAEKSDQNAIYYLKIAADGHYAPAMLALAERHRSGGNVGDGFAADPAEAYKLLREAVDLQTPEQQASWAGQKAKEALDGWPGHLASGYLLAIWRSPFITLAKALEVADQACREDPNQVDKAELQALELCREYWHMEERNEEFDKYRLVAEQVACAKAEGFEAVADLANGGNRVAQVAYSTTWKHGEGWDRARAQGYLRAAAAADYLPAFDPLVEAYREGSALKAEETYARCVLAKTLLERALALAPSSSEAPARRALDNAYPKYGAVESAYAIWLSPFLTPDRVKTKADEGLAWYTSSRRVENEQRKAITLYLSYCQQMAEKCKTDGDEAAARHWEAQKALYQGVVGHDLYADEEGI